MAPNYCVAGCSAFFTVFALAISIICRVLAGMSANTQTVSEKQLTALQGARDVACEIRRGPGDPEVTSVTLDVGYKNQDREQAKAIYCPFTVAYTDPDATGKANKSIAATAFAGYEFGSFTAVAACERVSPGNPNLQIDVPSLPPMHQGDMYFDADSSSPSFPLRGSWSCGDTGYVFCSDGKCEHRWGEFDRSTEEDRSSYSVSTLYHSPPCLVKGGDEAVLTARCSVDASSQVRLGSRAELLEHTEVKAQRAASDNEGLMNASYYFAGIAGFLAFLACFCGGICQELSNLCNELKDMMRRRREDEYRGSLNSMRGFESGSVVGLGEKTPPLEHDAESAAPPPQFAN
eukprot:TRINITY_DN81278_c0_g1_i1.p1 TRINITY_DN81278_c0_g1~~TRINITY_DN81278_c0_g1_i1.p1  ORF type:complete len:368 (+),score=31.60 TRINITY_DN81278_c0_g1_i1:64-1104(+)